MVSVYTLCRPWGPWVFTDTIPTYPAVFGASSGLRELLSGPGRIPAGAPPRGGRGPWRIPGASSTGGREGSGPGVRLFAGACSRGRRAEIAGPCALAESVPLFARAACPQAGAPLFAAVWHRTCSRGRVRRAPVRGCLFARPGPLVRGRVLEAARPGYAIPPKMSTKKGPRPVWRSPLACGSGRLSAPPNPPGCRCGQAYHNEKREPGFWLYRHKRDTVALVRGREASLFAALQDPAELVRGLLVRRRPGLIRGHVLLEECPCSRPCSRLTCPPPRSRR